MNANIGTGRIDPLRRDLSHLKGRLRRCRTALDQLNVTQFELSRLIKLSSPTLRASLNIVKAQEALREEIIFLDSEILRVSDLIEQAGGTVPAEPQVAPFGWASTEL